MVIVEIVVVVEVELRRCKLSVVGVDGRLFRVEGWVGLWEMKKGKENNSTNSVDRM